MVEKVSDTMRQTAAPRSSKAGLGAVSKLVRDVREVRQESQPEVAVLTKAQDRRNDLQNTSL